ncbi:MAG: diaminopimelate decarboxylase, partial [Alphaproteobacteria bacterium]
EFASRDGTLCAEDVAIARIAEAVGTPFYCYSSAALARAYESYLAAFAGLPATVCYSLKANGALAVVRTFAGLGAGADVVSLGELRQALAAGVPPARIVFSGVGKSEEELAAALDAGILQINVESAPELDALAALARARGRKAAVAIRINPNVDAATHAKITTGRSENKFGVDLAGARTLYARAARMAGLEVVGLAMHIGSQLTDLGPFRQALERLAALVRTLRADGSEVRRLDLGGGLGIRYRAEEPPDVTAYATLVREIVAPLGCPLILEPGRYLVGDAGVLVARVLYLKAGATRRFVIVDAAMNDLIRPALYDAYHEIRPVRPREGAAAPVDVVGPVCESSDTFATARLLPPVEAGDLLAILSTGAYGAAMASNYNGRPLAAEVMVQGGEWAVVRPRQDLAELLSRDRLPPWLGLERPRYGVA